MKRVGLIGTGFIARGIQQVLHKNTEFQISNILTRRPLEDLTKCLPEELLTQSKEELIDNSDIVLECSGDPVYASIVLEAAQKANKPILTMNCELQVTTGTYFARRGYISDCEGDQPGCLATLKDEVEIMGFRPLAYLNIKRFLNHNPNLEDMKHWAKKWNLTIEQIISFTDGTKLQIEQVLVANGLGCSIAQEGLLGKTVEKLSHTDIYGDRAQHLQQPLSDYVLCATAPPGVLIVAENPYDPDFHKDWGPIKSMFTAEGRYCTFLKNHHLCHLEIVKNLRRLESKLPPLINNSTKPRYGVAAIAKRKISKGSAIKTAIGSFDVRGEAIALENHPSHVPIGLLGGATFVRDVEEGAIVDFEDVDLPTSRAMEMYLESSEESIAEGTHV